MTTEERLSMLESKVARAERSKRRQLVAGLGVLLVVCALLWAGSSMNDNGKSSDGIWEEAAMLQKVVYANRFVLVDEDGRERARLAATKDGAWLAMLDENGKGRVILDSSKDGPSLRLYDENGKPRALLASLKSGPSLFLYDENDEVRVMLILLKDGPGLILYDENGKLRVGLTSDKDRAGLRLIDENDKPRVVLTSDKAGAALELQDEKGQIRAVLGTGVMETPDGKTITYPESSLRLFGPDGYVIRSLP